MLTPTEVHVPARDLARFRYLIGAGRFDELASKAVEIRALVDGRTIWNVNSTAAGGGVAEMLQVLVGYILDIGIEARWIVLGGDPEFFTITKRVHNRIHGFPGDDGDLGAGEAAHYESIAAANLESLIRRIEPGDVVLLHDPQTAALAGPLEDAGAIVIWRCHIGSDHTDRWTEQAWSFLRPYLEPCRAFVFSRPSYVPSWVPPEKLVVIPPSIDPFSPKNRRMTDRVVLRTLARLGVLEAPGGAFGPPGVADMAVLTGNRGLDPTTPLVAQISRWDRLKDMEGVLAGFAASVGTRSHARLALVGPAVDGVADDPEGALVLAECLDAWHRLPSRVRERVQIVTLPMHDLRTNALMVNALQRHASVLVQKSLAEGFGLTVAEGMWKGRAVVASAVGGIVDQMNHDTGVLLDEPTDLDAFGRALAGLLERPGLIAQLGRRARQRVLDHFVGDRHLLAYGDLVQRLVKGDVPTGHEPGFAVDRPPTILGGA